MSAFVNKIRNKIGKKKYNEDAGLNDVPSRNRGTGIDNEDDIDGLYDDDVPEGIENVEKEKAGNGENDAKDADVDPMNDEEEKQSEENQNGGVKKENDFGGQKEGVVDHANLNEVNNNNSNNNNNDPLDGNYTGGDNASEYSEDSVYEPVDGMTTGGGGDLQNEGVGMTDGLADKAAKLKAEQQEEDPAQNDEKEDVNNNDETPSDIPEDLLNKVIENQDAADNQNVEDDETDGMDQDQNDMDDMYDNPME